MDRRTLLKGAIAMTATVALPKANARSGWKFAWGAAVDPAFFGVASVIATEYLQVASPQDQQHALYELYRNRVKTRFDYAARSWLAQHGIKRSASAIKAHFAGQKYINLFSLQQYLNPVLPCRVALVGVGSRYPAGNFWAGWGFGHAIWTRGGLWQLTRGPESGAWVHSTQTDKRGVKMTYKWAKGGPRKAKLARMSQEWFRDNFGSPWSHPPIGVIVPEAQARRIEWWIEHRWAPAREFNRSLDNATAQHVAKRLRGQLLRS